MLTAACWTAAVSSIVLLTACGASTDAAPAPGSFELPPARTVQVDLHAGLARDFTVRLPANSAGEVSAQQAGFDVALLLLGETGGDDVMVDMPIGAEGIEVLSLTHLGSAARTFHLQVQEPNREARVALRFDIHPRITPEHRARTVAQRAYSQAQLYVETLPGRAEQHFRDAAHAWAQAGDVLYQTYALHKVATMLYEQHHYLEALELAREAQVRAETHGLHQARLGLLNFQAMQLKKLQRFSEARTLYHQVVDEAVEAQDTIIAAAALYNLGRLHRDSGQLEASLGFYADAARLQQETGRRHHYLDALRSKTEVLLDLQRCSDATTIVESLAPSEREDLDWLVVEGRIALCRATGKSQRYGRAGTGEPPAVFDKALRLSRQQRQLGTHLRIQMQLAKWHQLHGNQLGSLAALQLAHERVRPQDSTYPEILTLFGRTLVRNGFVRRGLRLLREAETVVSDQEALNASLYFALAEAHQRLDDLRLAQDYARRALEHAESLRREHLQEHNRADYRASKDHYYSLHVDLLMRLQGEADGGSESRYEIEAWQIAERYKSRALIERLLQDPSRLPLDADTDTLSERTLLQARLSELAGELFRARLQAGGTSQGTDNATPGAVEASRLRDLQFEEQQLRSRLQELDSQLLRTSPRLRQLEEPATLDLETLRSQLLDGETALISYNLGENGGYAWYIDRHNFRAMQVPPQAFREERIRSLNRAWSRSQAPADSYLQDLSRALLGGFTDLLTNQPLIISAAGPLHYLPFAALPHPADPTQVLLQRHVISYVPSISLLSVLRPNLAERTSGADKIFIAADPVFDLSDPRVPEHLRLAGPASAMPPPGAPNRDLLRSLEDLQDHDSQPLRLQRLPNTLGEAEAIRALNPGETVVHLGFEASRENLEHLNLEQFEILHFATHGFYNDHNPHLSGLVLSQLDSEGQPIEGFLSLTDIHRWHLEADLVVLSACETGLGRDVRGEGLQGLSQAFLYAGAPRLAVSLWRIDDAVTERLMKRFYSGLWEDQLGPAEALRQAQLELLHDGYPPRYWAAFILLGEWR